jgi:hypothetical protein
MIYGVDHSGKVFLGHSIAVDRYRIIVIFVCPKLTFEYSEIRRVGRIFWTG